MQILLVRHGIAEDREEFARSGNEDDLRPLTKEGRRKMRRAAQGIVSLTPRLTVVASSPLRRAVQTAQIIADRYDHLEPTQVPCLSPRKPMAALLTWVQSQPPTSVVALVGHEPHLGTFASWLLTGLQESFIPMKKGGACLISLEKEIKPGRGRLIWALKPSQLRKLGKC